MFGLARKKQQGESTRLITDEEVYGASGVEPLAGPEFIEAITKVSVAYAATHRIAEDIAAIPLLIKRGDDVLEPETNETAAIMQSVNSSEGRSAFWMKVMLNRLGLGSAFVLLDYQVKATPQEMFVLPGDQIEPIAGPAMRPEGYIYTGGGKQVEYEAREIWWSKLPHPTEPWKGLPPLYAAQPAAAIQMQVQQKLWEYFKNYQPLAGAVETDQHMTPQQIGEWRQTVRGLFSKEVLVNILGLKWKDIARTPQEQQMVEILKMARQDQAMVLGVPQAMIGLTEDVRYNTAPEQAQLYWGNTIPGHCRLLQEDITEVLLPRFEDGLTAEFDLDAVEAVQEMKLAKAEKYSAMISTAQMTLAEAREENGLPFIPGTDQLFISAGLVPLGAEPDIDKQPTRAAMKKQGTTNEASREVKRQQALRGLEEYEKPTAKDMAKFFRSQGLRVIQRLQATEKAMAKIPDEDDMDTLFPLDEELILLRDTYRNFMVRIIMNRGTETLTGVMGTPTDLISSQDVVEFIQGAKSPVAAKVVGVNEETKRQLRALISQANEHGWTLQRLTSAIDLRFQEFSRARALRIARTETTSSVGFADLEAFKQSGIVKSKEWLSSQDELVRGPIPHNHAIDGERVALTDSFSNGLQFPGDPTGEAGNVINCRCTMLRSIDEPPEPRHVIRPGLMRALKATSNGKEPQRVLT
jgi:HK97 family phage portal protein